jgi:hypothetical protein
MSVYAKDNCALNRGLPVIHCFTSNGGYRHIEPIEPDFIFSDCRLIQVYGESFELRVDEEGKTFFIPYSKITPAQVKEEARRKPNIIRLM